MNVFCVSHSAQCSAAFSLTHQTFRVSAVLQWALTIDFEVSHTELTVEPLKWNLIYVSMQKKFLVALRTQKV